MTIEDKNNQMPGDERHTDSVPGLGRSAGRGHGNTLQDSFFFFFVVNFVIHWNETAMGLHVFPIPIPPPTSLSTRSP